MSQRIRCNQLTKPTHYLTIAAFGLISSAHAAVYAHYSFDSDFTDGSGNGRDGTLTEVGTAASGITSSTGDHVFGGGAMDFSADRDYIAIPSVTFGSGSPYTIAFWAKKAPGDTGQAAQWDMVIGQRDGTTFFIALNDASGSGSRDGLRWRSSSTATERQADFSTVDDNAWHHYAVVASGSTISLYVDGGLNATATGKSTGFIVDTIGDAYTSGADFDFHGQIDEVWIFDEALDATEVSNLEQFNSTIPEPTTTGLAALGVIGMICRRRR